eukprot:UN10262
MALAQSSSSCETVSQVAAVVTQELHSRPPNSEDFMYIADKNGYCVRKDCEAVRKVNEEEWPQVPEKESKVAGIHVEHEGNKNGDSLSIISWDSILTSCKSASASSSVTSTVSSTGLLKRAGEQL